MIETVPQPATATATAIEIRDVGFRYREDGPQVLRGVSLSVPLGGRLLVAGPSGSGKSTFLRLLNGLVPHFHGGVLSGRVRVAGRDPVALGPGGMSDAVGFVFQNPEAQFVAERVEDEVAFALENHGVPPEEMRRRLDTVLTGLDLGPLQHRRLTTLSGGERQRVALAGALVLEPAVLVLDEPTSQLDPRTAEGLFRLLEELPARLGGSSDGGSQGRPPVTLVLSEHRLDRVAHRADLACLFSDTGEPPRVGAPRDVLEGSDLAPPVTRLGRKLGWRPPPLTAAEAAAWATERPTAGSGIVPESDLVPGSDPVPGSDLAPSDLTPGSTLVCGRDLEFRYPGTRYAGWDGPALRGVSFALSAGERVALLGPNGSGKSTLLKLLVGLLRPTGGRVEIHGEDTRDLDLLEVTATVGFVPQNPSRLLFQETVAGEVRYTRVSHGLPPAEETAPNVPVPLARLDLAAHAETHPFDLSTGERQRAALAALLAAEPEVLLLDEPTRGLDAPRKEALARLLAELAAEGVAVLLATHDVELVAEWARRALVLEDGAVAADGPVREVLAGPVGERLRLRPQLLQLWGDPSILTVEDALGHRIEEPR